MVHEANCASKLEREVNKRGSTRKPQHNQVSTAKIKKKPRQTWFSSIVQLTGRDAQRSIEEATDRHLWTVITRQPLDRR